MGRPARSEQLAALQRIREAMSQHGDEMGQRIARADYARVPAPTWSRWCKQVREENARFAAAEAVVPMATGAATSQPPSVAARESFAVEQGGPVDFFAQLRLMIEDADMLRGYAAPIDPATGARRVRNPAMLGSSTKLRALALGLMQRHAEAAWAIEAVQRQYNEVMTVLGKSLGEARDRELSARIIGDLRAMNERWEAEQNFGRPAELGAA